MHTKIEVAKTDTENGQKSKETKMATTKKVSKTGTRHDPYRSTYEHTRSMIHALSGLSARRLEGISFELENRFAIYRDAYSGPEPVDDHDYFAELLQDRLTSWDNFDGVVLSGLTLAQVFFAWAWALNNEAKYFFDLDDRASGRSRECVLPFGIRAAIGAAKSLAHARLLMVSGDTRRGQNAP